MNVVEWANESPFVFHIVDLEFAIWRDTTKHELTQVLHQNNGRLTIPVGWRSNRFL